MATTEASPGVMKSGTAANDHLALDSAGKIPAVPGDQVTGLVRGLALQGVADLTNAGSNDQTFYEWNSLPAALTQLRLVIAGASVEVATRLGIQLGDAAGGLKTAGYLGIVSDEGGTSATLGDAFRLINSDLDIASNYTWWVALTKAGTDEWLCEARGLKEGAAASATHSTLGRVVLPGALDRVRLLTIAAQDFDAGNAALYTDKKS